MLTSIANAFAISFFRGYRPAGRGSMEVVLLLVGLVFAGLLVWAIQQSGKPTVE